MREEIMLIKQRSKEDHDPGLANDLIGLELLEHF